MTDDSMLRTEKNGIHLLEFSLFRPYPRLKHGIVLHRDLGINPDEKPSEEILSHKKRLTETFDLPEPLYARQLHGTDIISVGSGTEGPFFCDGFITQEKNKTLCIKHADCQAALFYDPVVEAIAAVHCGWRGNVQNIYKKTIDGMRTCYGTLPENLLVGISPSLGPDAAEFRNYREMFPESFFPYRIGSRHFDLWAVSRMQLLECGVREKNIEIAGICTYESKDFFSYRRTKGKERNLTFCLLEAR